MNPWVEISLQDEWWVPMIGWYTWSTTHDLEALTPGIQRIEVVSMTPEHRVRAGALMVRRTLEIEHLRASFPIDYDESASPMLKVDPLQVQRTAAMSPLAAALCAGTDMITACLDDPAVADLFASARRSRAGVLGPADFDVMNDALAGALVVQAAHVAQGSLLAKLLCQRVLLPDALKLSQALAL